MKMQGLIRVFGVIFMILGVIFGMASGMSNFDYAIWFLLIALNTLSLADIWDK